jgi:hypothetical protein
MCLLTALADGVRVHLARARAHEDPALYPDGYALRQDQRPQGLHRRRALEVQSRAAHQGEPRMQTHTHTPITSL